MVEERKPVESARTILRRVLQAHQLDRTVIVVDENLMDFATPFLSAALTVTQMASVLELATAESRAEQLVRLRSKLSRMDFTLFLSILRHRRGEARFRRSVVRLAERLGCRIGHIVGPQLRWLTTGPLSLTSDEYDQMEDAALRLLDMLAKAKEVTIVSEEGTQLRLELVKGRYGTTDCMTFFGTSRVSLPIGEVWIAPKEGVAEGRIVTRRLLGRIEELPLTTIEVRGGRAYRIECDDPRIRERLSEAMKKGVEYLGSLSIGINPRAQAGALSGYEAAKAKGVVHIGFGRNVHLGGKIDALRRLEFMVRKAEVRIDGTPLVV